ncbi:DUF58 domain-containing protein [Candidatus Methylocalor cossyra]|uniref:DUF58 domain-containing protein n=1 Tax=Candidatus Methylocalor cossyra TaxID=3108543 RepID=A0ABM9NI73_9GAMM
MAAPTLRDLLDPRRFLRAGQPVAGPIRLSHRRIFIVPNRRGLGLALLLLIQWLTSINYNSNLGFILTYLLAALLPLAALHSYRNLAGLQLQARRGAPVFVGDRATFELIVDNPTALPRYALWLRHQGDRPVRLDLPAHSSDRAVLTLETARRGWLQPGTITLSTEFPLGLFHAWSPLRFSERILVYPRPAPDPAPFPPAPGPGETPPSALGGEDFAGFRAYQAGDPVRQVHWKGVAKGYPPQVRRYAGELAEELLFRFEETPGADTELRLGRLCRWILDAEAAHRRYALALPGIQIPARNGAAHCRQCLEALALFRL